MLEFENSEIAFSGHHDGPVGNYSYTSSLSQNILNYNSSVIFRSFIDGNLEYNLTESIFTSVKVNIDEMDISFEPDSDFSIKLDLTCSPSGLYEFDYSLGQYQSYIVPDWVNLDVESLTLTGRIPIVFESTTFAFYVTARPKTSRRNLNSLIQPLYNKLVKFEVFAESISTDASGIKIWMHIIIWLAILIDLVTSILDKTRPVALWMIIQSIQLLQFFLLIKLKLPSAGKDYLNSLHYFF